MASRLCHDLISPISAINNGVELAEDLGEDGQAEAWALIGSSAKQASVRLQCLRLAYGAAGSGANIDLAEVRRNFTDWLAGTRTKLEWPDAALKAENAPAGFAKVALNTLILASECNAHNAVISVNLQNGAIEIRVVGDAVGFREGAKEALEGTADIDALDPRSVHGYITGQFARHFCVELSPTGEKGSLSFRLTF